MSSSSFSAGDRVDSSGSESLGASTSINQSQGEDGPLLSPQPSCVSEEEDYLHHPDDYRFLRRTRSLVNSYGAFRNGYEQRRHNEDYVVVPDHGTFLGMQIPSINEVPEMDNPVTVALKRCKELVLKPYMVLLTILGWRPLFLNASGSRLTSLLNVLHILVIAAFVLLAYVIQYASCFHRDRAIPSQHIMPARHSNKTRPGDQSNRTVAGACPEDEFWAFIVPDILHTLAYGYAFYMLRIAQEEHLFNMMEKVFLQSSPTHSGYLSQRKLIRTLRVLLWLALLWTVTSCVSQVLHLVAQYDDIHMSFLDTGNATVKATLLALMLVGFLALDVVYVAVVTSWCVQCQLLVVYFRGLKEKVREKSYSLQHAIKDIGEAGKYLKVLNSRMAPAVALLMCNFGVSAIIGLDAALISDKTGAWRYVMESASNVLYVILWFVIGAAPLIQAARVSAAGNSLRKLGHEVRSRPFGYSRSPREELDSFMLYTSTLVYKAKIFWIPITTTCLCCFIAAFFFLLLLILQLDSLHMWW